MSRQPEFGIGSPAYFGDCFRLATNFHIKEEWGITDTDRVITFVANRLGMSPAEIENLQNGTAGKPSLEEIMDWNQRLGLHEDIGEDLIFVAGYVPPYGRDLALHPATISRALAELLAPGRGGLFAVIKTYLRRR